MQSLSEVRHLKEKSIWELEVSWAINRYSQKENSSSVSVGDAEVNKPQLVSLLCYFSKHLTIHMNLRGSIFQTYWTLKYSLLMAGMFVNL